MTSAQKKKGNEGEDRALRFLEDQGYILLEKNFRIPGGEIDLIVEKEGLLVFVEVKARSTLHFGHPLESITPAKKQALFRTLWAFLEKKDFLGRPFRVDMITLFQGKIEHFLHILEGEVS